VTLAPAATQRFPLPAGGEAFADATTAQRFEVKFWATEEQAAAMLRIASQHMTIDKFCRNGPQRNISLYLDSPNRIFFEEHLAQVLALPGVKAASATTLVPLSGHSGTFFEAEGAPPKRPDEPNPVVLWRRVFPGYAEAIGLTLLSGKFISDENKHGAGVNVVVVNESFAKLNWPGQEAVGKRIRFPSDKNPWMTVIGVVRNVPRVREAAYADIRGVLGKAVGKEVRFEAEAEPAWAR